MPDRNALPLVLFALLALTFVCFTSASAATPDARYSIPVQDDQRVDYETLLDELLRQSENEGDRKPLRRVVRANQEDDGVSAFEKLLQKFSFTDNLNRLHSIMTIPELIRAQGYPSEIHKVVTADGYILELHRIPGPRIRDKVILPQYQSRRKKKKSLGKSTAHSREGFVTPNRFKNKRRRRRSSLVQTSSANLLNIFPNLNITTLDIISKAVFEDDGDTDIKSQYLFNLFRNILEDYLSLNVSELSNTERPVSARRNRAADDLDLLATVGLTNPLRGITNLALPLLNKPARHSAARDSNGNFVSRLVEITGPSPMPPKTPFFKNTSASVNFSPKMDLEISTFFGTSRGDSGASGKPVALLHHGLFSSSANFVLNDAHEALAYLLADAGYDVWMTNWRGNTYSRGHVRLDPSHSDYWKFSLDEVIRFDIPAVFDYVLRKTLQPDLYYVGHSLGCVMFWGATNYYPWLNSKVRVMVAMAPAGFMDSAEGLMKKMAQLMKYFYPYLEKLGIHEFLVPNSARTTLANTLCGPQNPIMHLCYAILPLYIGEVRGSHDPYYTDVFLSHFPGGTSSIRILAQFGQFVNAGGMQMFDFGRSENVRRYGRLRPPKYSFKTVTVPVAIMWAMGDTVTTAKDTQRCARALPNLIANYRVPQDKFNHIDFFFSEYATDLVNRPILRLLQQY